MRLRGGACAPSCPPLPTRRAALLISWGLCAVVFLEVAPAKHLRTLPSARRGASSKPAPPLIPTNVPLWALDKTPFDTPGRFTDPITNITGPHSVPPAPRALVAGWPTAKAQGSEDLYAQSTLFYSLGRPGFIVESGALDGCQFSVSWWLTFVFGWRAVHVEPSPRNFRALNAWRPESLNFQAALCKERNGVPLHFAESDTATPMPTDGIFEFMSQDFKATWWPEALANESIVASFAPVHCSSLDALLAPYEVPFIDLWVLDVEGAELGVVETHDFEKLPVHVFCIEIDDYAFDALADSKVGQLFRFLLTRGFNWFSYMPPIGNPRNTWFVHETFAPTCNPECCRLSEKSEEFRAAHGCMRECC